MSFKYSVNVLGKKYEVEVSELSPGIFEVQISGKRAVIEIARKLPAIERKSAQSISVTRKRVERAGIEAGREKPVISGESKIVDAPMTGVVTKILKREGDEVKEGETVLIIEAMKMENSISSPFSGVISKIFVEEGSKVSSGEPLFFVS